MQMSFFHNEQTRGGSSRNVESSDNVENVRFRIANCWTSLFIYPFVHILLTLKKDLFYQNLRLSAWSDKIRRAEEASESCTFTGRKV